MIKRVSNYRRPNSIVILPFVLLLLLAACQPPEVAPRRTTVIHIAGSTAMQPDL